MNSGIWSSIEALDWSLSWTISVIGWDMVCGTVGVVCVAMRGCVMLGLLAMLQQKEGKLLVKGRGSVLVVGRGTVDFI